MKTVRLRIMGQVTGVGYRAWTLATATRLGLRGWVRNRADGSVEVLATGPDEAVAALIEAARHGPIAARVGEIRIDGDEGDGSFGFSARPTV